MVDGLSAVLTAHNTAQRTVYTSLTETWVQSAETSATPGTIEMTPTNSGKAIITEYSDADAFANEFVEIYCDITP